MHHEFAAMWIDQARDRAYLLDPKDLRLHCNPKWLRESVLEAKRNEIRAGKLLLIIPVMTSTEGLWVANIK